MSWVQPAYIPYPQKPLNSGVHQRMPDKNELSLTLSSSWILFELQNHQDANFDWMPDHQVPFVSLKGALIQAPLLCYLNPLKWYVVYTDASDNACSAQLSKGTQQSRLISHVSFTHIHRHSAKMEHSQSRSLWCLLCHKTMELLSPGIWLHHT